MTQSSAGATSYHYNPHLGSPRDEYRRVDFRSTRSHQPEQPGRFAVLVEGETIVTSMWGRRVVNWRADPGTPCLILGYWSDGTVHLKWPGLARNYMLDGRFPPWVVEEDPDALTAGGGFVLRANDILPVPAGISWRPVVLLVLLVLLVFVLLWPPAREVVQGVLGASR
jgi:hypothetical protein